MSLRRHLLAASLALVLVSPGIPLSAEPFTFQGFLEQSGSPLNGNANLAFKLYDAQSGGTQQGATISANSYPVLDGVFTIDLNFAGVAFADANRWLQVEVNGTPMGPRIEILPAPVAASTRALQGRGVSATAPSSGQVLKWNGSAWAPAADAGGTSYTAGTGLALSGSAFSVAPTYQLPQSCSNNQIAKWTGSAWACGTDADTTYTAGAGLVLSGSSFGIDFAGSGAAVTAARSDHGHYGATWSGVVAMSGLTVSNSFPVESARAISGIYGESSISGTGVYGEALRGNGVLGYGETGVRGRGFFAGVAGETSGSPQSGEFFGVLGSSAATSGASRGVFGEVISPDGIGVKGVSRATTGFGQGIRGESYSSGDGGGGVIGVATSGTGVHSGVVGVNNSSSAGARGVLGVAESNTGATIGVHGVAQSPTGTGVRGEAAAASGANVGVRGTSASTAGRGVAGFATATSGNTYGVWGESSSPTGHGVLGNATATSGANFGVRGESASPDGFGVFGFATATGGVNYGVWGETLSPTGRGMLGYARATSGTNYGVYGRSDSPEGTGVLGWNTAVSGSTAYGVWGEAASNQARAVFGDATATAGPATGIYGRAASTTGTGVRGEASAATGNTVGVRGTAASTTGIGVRGEALSSSGSNVGVLARTASGDGVGLRAENTDTVGSGGGRALEAIGNRPDGDTLVVEANGTGNAWAIRASSAGTSAVHATLTSGGTTGSAVTAVAASTAGRAGFFQNSAVGGQAAQFIGTVDVSGTLSATTKLFRIDHPLDPANRYLQHIAIESDEMANIYSGNVVTDANGRATIELPEWFETLNRDFRYQLTVIGEFAQAVVSKKVEQNRFEIRTSSPKVEVSWQVTGIRQDAWAERNRIPVELDKAGDERGKFLHPEAHGQPADKRIGAIAETKE